MSKKRNNIHYQKAANFLGIIISFFAVAVIVFKLWENRSFFLHWDFSDLTIIVIIFCSIVYFFSNFLLSYAWQRLLTWFGQHSLDHKTLHMIYARSQIAKYIPGNIFHFAGRHLMGKQAGLEHQQLAGAALSEVCALIIVSSAIAFVGLVFFKSAVNQLSLLSVIIIFTVTLPIILLLNLFIPTFSRLRNYQCHKKTLPEAMGTFSVVYLLHFFFFLIANGILAAIIYAVTGGIKLNQLGIISTTFAISWIAGFITPGAPSGIGIREAIIVTSLSGFLGEPKSLLVAILFRVITISGDVLFFLSSFLMRGELLREKDALSVK